MTNSQSQKAAFVRVGATQIFKDNGQTPSVQINQM